MSFDRLQSLIKTTKCPLAIQLSPAGEETAGSFLSFARNLVDELRGVVPALRLSLGDCARLGWQGIQALEELLSYAGEKGIFTLLDLSFCDGSAPISAFPADCFVVSGYLGSDSLTPLLEECRKAEKCLFVLAHTANSSAWELQDLVAGDRLVYQVVGDLARRLGKDDLGSLGYSRAGIVAEGVYPSDLRTLRKRWEQNFLLVSGTAGDVRFAFDRYGRGALVSTVEPVAAARAADGTPSTALERAKALRDELKQYITIL